MRHDFILKIQKKKIVALNFIISTQYKQHGVFKDVHNIQALILISVNYIKQ